MIDTSKAVKFQNTSDGTGKAFAVYGIILIINALLKVTKFCISLQEIRIQFWQLWHPMD
jgi:hypothetical protein